MNCFVQCLFCTLAQFAYKGKKIGLQHYTLSLIINNF